ncbi:hypothetical protein RA27_02405 [Ruegeria sp. ANG-R]|uniref:hypothetical protein n=1 Tax=Ruegeria sp. ANG-R TaxID=1577903 RepID=UPI00057EA7DF|nr:hypothetical protein [Ruegeria sp. ANG-R]KIC42255.1 hypothetical protein RA27_02405 [Ruegeria sp. ANG-R]
MEERHEQRISSAAEALGDLPPHLADEYGHYLSVEDREYEPSLGDFLAQWIARHEDDPKAGWLDRQSLRFIRKALISARIAIPTSELDAAYIERWRSDGKSNVWFRQDGTAYEFEPDFDEEQKHRSQRQKQ